MPFDPNKPVSLDEYNETLSKSYGQIYEHLKNDPTLSMEEFVQQASAMSEKYHDALQEFQDAQNAKAEENVNVAGGVQPAETNGVQNNTTTVDATGFSAMDTNSVDSGVSEGSISGISGDSVGSSGIDNDDNDVSDCFDSVQDDFTGDIGIDNDDNGVDGGLGL